MRAISAIKAAATREPIEKQHIINWAIRAMENLKSRSYILSKLRKANVSVFTYTAVYQYYN